MELQDRVVIVTGGAVRIGRELCLSLARAGMKICLHYGSSAEAARQTAADISELGVAVTSVQSDLADPETAATRIVDAALSAFGQVDALINNASIFEPGSLNALTVEDWHRHQTINVAAPAFLAQRFAAELHKRPEGQGAIINIVDWRGLQPQPGHLAYTISKSGLIALTRILAQELAPRIRVNAIAPGAVLPSAHAAEDFDAQMAAVVPLRRIGAPCDVADATLYLLRADFVTGEVLSITGGQQLPVRQPVTV